ncbi:hypothetical protein QQZ08_007638 [Neonectria magnoliae]|uniref:Uncharacterized protein n=1 Tax=Neonectria magnoliae TaxID=2732573 RepID=A0ABR1HY82_9HYPO
MLAVDDPIEILKSVGRNRGELNMIFHFDIMGMNHGNEGKFSPRKWATSDLKAIVNKWQTFMYE